MKNALQTNTNLTYTENGATTFRSTMSACLDLFATVGGMRNAPDAEIFTRFQRAWAENRDDALRILFYTRDVRGGLGERRIFRETLKELARYEPASVRKNLCHIPEYGRYDDLLALLDTPVADDMVRFVREQLALDQQALEKEDAPVSLLGKWLPSANASKLETRRLGREMARRLHMSDAAYRRLLTALRARISIIENNLREKDYSFDYQIQPSQALYKYRRAFWRNDEERYSAYLKGVQSGELRMNTQTLMPYQVIRPMLTDESLTAQERLSAQTAWDAMPDYTRQGNALAVIDGSGSMYGRATPEPITVALSLGLYFAQRNQGAFRGCFLTFSENPQLVDIKGQDLYEQVRYAASFNEVANTNIQRTFEVLLQAALSKGAKQEELPDTVYIISDMEFDVCTEDASSTNFDYAKALYARHGYKLPRLVYWNVASRAQQMPVTMNETGTVLVSGCNPRLFGMILQDNLNPYLMMRQVLDAERYARITA